MSAPIDWLRDLASGEPIVITHRPIGALEALEALEAAKAVQDLLSNYDSDFGEIKAAVKRHRLALAAVWGES